MVPLGGKPLLAHWIEAIACYGSSENGPQVDAFDEILVNTHYLAEVVDAFVSASPWAKRITLLHETNLLGTAGTLRANIERLGESDFFMAHADNASRFSVSHFIKRFRERPKGCVGTMMTFETDTPQSCGIVQVDQAGVVVDYVEKVANPTGNVANAAVFIFDPTIHGIVDRLPLATDFCADVVPHLVGRINTFHNTEYHRDIGTPASYAQALEDFA